MKILYISKADHVDYQDDCLTIGLRELLEENLIDYNKRSHIYTNYSQEDALKLYGKGFSVTRVLDDIQIDRNDITNKIKSKYFDFIVYGSIWRCSDYIDEILKYYPAHKVIAVDGEDETNIHSVYNKGILYFKRELVHSAPRLYPISFAIPTNKVNFCTNKTRDIAICDPRDRSTYIYKNEPDYYKGYQEARFGVTVKKAGWDCMRHYEILANGCLPLFLDIEQCPKTTMTNFPKSQCISILSDYKKESLKNVYDKHCNNLEKHLLLHNTTLALGKYFIDLCKDTI